MGTEQFHDKRSLSFVTLHRDLRQPGWGETVTGCVPEKEHICLEYQQDLMASNLEPLFYVKTNADRKSKREC